MKLHISAGDIKLDNNYAIYGSLSTSGNSREILKYDSGNDLYVGGGIANNYYFAQTGDTNIHIYPFGDYIRFFTANSEAMRIVSGNVGIGTTSPTSLLQVAGATAPKITLSDTDATTQKHWFLESDSNKFNIGTTSDALVTDSIYRPLTINSSGYVGIGTTSPSALLTIASVVANVSNIVGGEPTSGGIIKIVSAGGTTSNVGGLEFKTAGSGSGYGWRITAPNLGDGETPLYFQRRSNSAAWTDSATILGTNGYMGIGTTSPYAKLTVWGSGTGTNQLVNFVNSASSSLFTLLENGNLGIATTSPYASLSVAGGSGVVANLFTATSSTATTTLAGGLSVAGSSGLTVLQNGNVGIGTAGPAVKTQIVSGNANPMTAGTPVGHLSLISASGNYGMWLGVAGTGSAWIQAARGDSGTTYDLLLQTNGGNVGIGITTPTSLLQVAGATAPKITLSDTDASSNQKHWFMESNTGSFNIGTTSDALVTNTSYRALTINSSGNVGIGTASPADNLVVQRDSGQASLAIKGTEAAGSYVNAYLTMETASTMRGKGLLLSETSTSKAWFAGVPYGNDLFQIGYASTGSAKENASGPYMTGQAKLVLLSSGNLGIGTTTPTSLLQVAGATAPKITLSDTDATTQKHWFLESDSNKFNIGTTSDALVTNTSYRALTINSSGNVGIGTTSPSALLTLFNIGAVGVGNIVGGEPTYGGVLKIVSAGGTTANVGGLEFKIAGTGSGYGWRITAPNLGDGETPLYFQRRSNSAAWTDSATILGTNGYMGVGTTTPYAKLSLVLNTSTLKDILVISTSTSGLIFKVDSYGATYADAAYTSPAADYAEYFLTSDRDLRPGEVICVDILQNNAVKRCQRGHDNNVMGVVSTKPAVIGNYIKRVIDKPDNYAIVGMLGQVEALASAENGPIGVGDSLTSASSTPGHAMRADGGDATMAVALEPLAAGSGKIKVLISRRNKSLAVEEVEALVVERIANMEIEDQVQTMIKQAVDNLNLDPKIQKIAQEEAGKLDAALTVGLNDANGQIASLKDKIFNFQLSIFNEFSNLNDKISNLNSQVAELGLTVASSTALAANIKVDEGGNLVIGPLPASPAPNVAGEGQGEGPKVEIVEPTEIAASSTQTALVVNQTGLGDVADFQAQGVSILTIAETGQVKVVGSLLVDGRIMLCTGGDCSNALDSAVDETMADLGVEGKVVAGAFEGYCADGFVWAPGSAKYGTLPGFCVMADLTPSPSPSQEREAWTNVSQGEAQYACQSLGAGYHLLSENEWLTLAENILQVVENDMDKEKAGAQLASSTSETPLTPLYKGGGTAFKLTNDNVIYNLAGGIAQWTSQNVTVAGLPALTPNPSPAPNVAGEGSDWYEYYQVADYKGLNIAPDYYLSDATNQIGKIKVDPLTPDPSPAPNVAGEGSLRGFVRGQGGIYGLDLSHAPTEKAANIGFRCGR
jgi:hypothetical protein